MRRLHWNEAEEAWANPNGHEKKQKGIDGPSEQI